ncbi:MAG: hypothetical protein ACYC35_12950 [Pirellulales bacterium]
MRAAPQPDSRPERTLLERAGELLAGPSPARREEAGQAELDEQIGRRVD